MGMFKKLGTFAGNLFGGSSQKPKLFPKHGDQATWEKAHTAAHAQHIQGNKLPSSTGSNSADIDNAMAEYRDAVARATASARLQTENDLRRGEVTVSNPTMENLFDVWRSELEQEARDRERQKSEWMSQQQRNMDPLTRFIFGEYIEVISSNVAAAQYDRENQFLYLIFKNTAWYRYGNISPAEAEQFFLAGSKGGFVWDALRVRGTIFGHKKPYDFMRYGGSYQPRYVNSSTFEAEHAAIPMTGDIPESWIAGKGPYSVHWLVTRNPKLFPAAKILSSGVEDVGTFGDLLKGDVKGVF